MPILRTLSIVVEEGINIPWERTEDFVLASLANQPNLTYNHTHTHTHPKKKEKEEEAG